MPLSLGCAWWALYNGWVVLTGRGLGMILDGPTGTALGSLSLFAGVLLVAGWWARRLAWMRHGMILVACLLGGTSITLFAESGVGNISAGYNLPWCAAAAGAWLIEVRDARPNRP